MKKSVFSLVFVLAILVVPAVTHANTPIEGRWHTPNAEGTVEIKVAEEALSGKLVASSNIRAKLGTVILRDFVRDGDKWKGKRYVPKRDKILDAQLSLHGGKLVVKVSAGLRHKSIIWTRADAP